MPVGAKLSALVRTGLWAHPASYTPSAIGLPYYLKLLTFFVVFMGG